MYAFDLVFLVCLKPEMYEATSLLVNQNIDANIAKTQIQTFAKTISANAK